MASINEGKLSSQRVLMLGASLLAIGTLGFYYIPGMILEGAAGSHLVNAFYCAAITLTTVGFGDICPGDLTTTGRIFLGGFSLGSLGMFCGPFMQLTSSWKDDVPGGIATLASLVLGMGATIFTVLEGRPQSEAVYASIVTGTTIGYGDMTPVTDLGKIAIAIYAIVAVNVVVALLVPARQYLEGFCRVKEVAKYSDAKLA